MTTPTLSPIPVKPKRGPWLVKQLIGTTKTGWVILWPDKDGRHMRRLDHNGAFTEADARLAGAAPELRDALQGLLATVKRTAANGAACDAAAAALAKAGEASS